MDFRPIFFFSFGLYTKITTGKAVRRKKSDDNKIGQTTDDGARLPAAVRSAITEVGIACSEAALSVKSTASE